MAIQDARRPADRAPQRDAPRRRATATASFRPAAAIDGSTRRGRLGCSRRRRPEPPPGSGDRGAGRAQARRPRSRVVLHQNAGQGRDARPIPPRGDHATPRPSARTPGLERHEEILAIAAARAPERRRSSEDRTRCEVLPARGARAGARRAPALRAAELREGGAPSRTSRSRWSRPPQEPEPVRILPRGNWLDESGEVVDARRPPLPAARSTTGGRPGDAPRPRALADLAATTRSPRACS